MSHPESIPTELVTYRERVRRTPLPDKADPTALPTGTVTFLLTDIEGSTRQWEESGPEMAKAVGRHYEILDAAVRGHRGVRPIEQGEGDSLVAAFERATDAVAAALDAQRRLITEAWPDGITIAVRMALHTGEAQIRDGRYYAGPSIIRCARMRGVGSGGQILISGTTADLLSGGLPAHSALLPLGVHRLRDLVDSQRVFQLLHPELPADFAPLKSLDLMPNNLPVALSTLIGREQESAELVGLGRAHRLVTLVGPGGSGKTRLATRSAAETLDEYPEGVWWIDLSPLTDPARVPLAVMNGLGMGDDRGLDPVERIVSCLASRRMRLVLDNCEHVGAATAATVDTLLRRCPGLSVLATSREPLGVPGEVVWRVTPMALPGPDAALAETAGAEAVQLFVQRCTEARPGFTLTADLAPTVAAICQRLDGLPLAIELAAARVRTMSPGRILAALTDRFRLLTGGARTALARQQTLQASVEWSHHLLGERERVVFRRLAACAGGFDLDAAEAVAAGGDVEDWEVLDVLSGLVDKSLVTFDGERYGMLQTIADFASAQLLAAGEADAVRDRHAAHFLERSEAAAALLTRQVRTDLLGGLETDHDNLRAALEWTVVRSGDDEALRFVVALASFWYVSGYYTEGLMWHRRVLARVPDGTTPLRCMAVASLGQLSLNCAELSTGLGYVDVTEAVRQARELGDPALLARPLAASARYQVLGLPGDALATLDEALAAARAAGDEWAVANVLFWQAFYWVFNRNLPAHAEAALDELDRIGRRAESLSILGWNDCVRAIGDWINGRVERARAGLDRAIANAEASGDVLLQCYSVGLGVFTWLDFGEHAEAEAMVLRTVARARRALDDCRQCVVEFGLVHIALARGELATAAQQLAKQSDLIRAIGLPFLNEWMCWAQGTIALAGGNLVASRAAFDEAAASAEASGVPLSRVVAALHLGSLAAAQGEAGAAESALHRALAIEVECDMRGLATDTFEGLAALAAHGGNATEAARLLGAAATLRTQTGRQRAPATEHLHLATVAALTESLGSEGYDRAHTEGAALEFVEAAGYASRARGERKRPASGWSALTPTELEVVAVAATGASNAQIGAALFMSPTTAKTHLHHIFAKLGVANRAALAALAAGRGAREDRSG